jgi:hypothetical protein
LRDDTDLIAAIPGRFSVTSGLPSAVVPDRAVVDLDEVHPADRRSFSLDRPLHNSGRRFLPI